MQPEPITEVDELTGLFRRGAFDRNLADYISESRSEEPLSLIMADIDKFKSINDTHGHPCGDEILRLVATIIKQTVGAKGRCYRYGGEEISILLKNYTADEAVSLAERVRLRISSSTLGSKQLAVTLSFGIAEVPAHARTGTDLLKAADAALYEAKNLGRNLVRISGEPEPTPASPRDANRKQPDPNTLMEEEAEQIRVHYFTYHHAFCPRDGAQLRIKESHPVNQQTPTLVISCALCGLSERLHGIMRTP
jgi:diguanylate cyclase (GGDEF)-like protein